MVVVASSEGPALSWSSSAEETKETSRTGSGSSSSTARRPRAEEELSLQLLRSYASSVQHQQYHDTNIITVRVDPPGTR